MILAYLIDTFDCYTFELIDLYIKINHLPQMHVIMVMNLARNKSIE